MNKARRFHRDPGEILGALALVTVAVIVAHAVSPLLALLVAPALIVLLLRMGFNVDETLVLVAIVALIIALSLPSVSGHGPHRQPKKSSERGAGTLYDSSRKLAVASDSNATTSTRLACSRVATADVVQFPRRTQITLGGLPYRGERCWKSESFETIARPC